VTTPEPHPAHTPGTDPTLGALGGGLTGPHIPVSDPLTTATPTQPAQPARRTGKGKTASRALALTLLIFVVVVLVLFVVFNTQTVDIDLVFAHVRAPLVVALVIAAVLGGLLVGLADALLTVRRRRNR